MFDPLSGFQACNNVVFLGDALGRDDKRDMAADGLLGGVTEQPLGGRIPALDDTVEGLTDNGIIRGFNDRREQPGREKLAGLVAIHAPLPCDVSENQHAPGDGAALVDDRCGAVIDRGFAAALLNQQGVIRQPNDDSFPQRLCRRVVNRLTRFFVDDLKHDVERSA